MTSAICHPFAEGPAHDIVSLEGGSVAVVSRAGLAGCAGWQEAFGARRKDHRFYELVEDTIRPGFDYRYFVLTDRSGVVRGFQPFFILDQDLLAGVLPDQRSLVHSVRRLWPRFLKMRTLMVGTAVGEGHLDGAEDRRECNAALLAQAIVRHARKMRVSLVVLKEFPARYRESLRCFLVHGFARAPSFPMTRLNIDYPSFEAYTVRALNSATRRKLRKKFSAADAAPPITMEIVGDVTPIIDDVYPLYLQVYDRSSFHFEKLTKEFLCELGHRMPDKVRFFLWQQHNRIVAFSLCMVEDDSLYAEYIGLDYSVAFDLHLYHYAVRDMIKWSMAHGYKWFRSSGLNYDPKLHLRHLLDPVDLYVRHTSAIFNILIKQILPLIEPTRFDPVLKKFANYDELWGDPGRS